MYENVPHSIIRLGAIGDILKTLKSHDVRDIVFAGHVRRPGLLDLRPDKTALKWLARLGPKSTGDDGLFKGIVDELGKEGFTVVGVHTLLPQCLAALGVLGRHQPTAQDWNDIKKGLAVAKDLGKWDVGQGVVVEHGLVLSVEAIEGTAAMLARTGPLKRVHQGGVLVKVLKPDQEMRIDLPSIGPETIQQAANCGLSGIALEAGAALIIAPEDTVRKANALGLFVVGINP